MRDTIKFAVMLMAAAWLWTVINPVHIIVGVIVSAFPVVMILGIAGLAVAGYRMMQRRFVIQEDDEL